MPRTRHVLVPSVVPRLVLRWRSGGVLKTLLLLLLLLLLLRGRRTCCRVPRPAKPALGLGPKAKSQSGRTVLAAAVRTSPVRVLRLGWCPGRVMVALRASLRRAADAADAASTGRQCGIQRVARFAPRLGSEAVEAGVVRAARVGAAPVRAFHRPAMARHHSDPPELYHVTNGNATHGAAQPSSGRRDWPARHNRKSKKKSLVCWPARASSGLGQPTNLKAQSFPRFRGCQSARRGGREGYRG